MKSNKSAALNRTRYVFQLTYTPEERLRDHAWIDRLPYTSKQTKAALKAHVSRRTDWSRA